MTQQLEQVQRIVHRVSGDWRGAPPLTVVERPSDLPVPAPDDVRGLYWRGQAYVVGHQPLQLVGQTVIHEVVGHHAMGQLLGSRWRSFVLAVGAGARRDFLLSLMRAHVRGTYGDLPAVSEANEIVATAAEHWYNDRTGRIEGWRPVKARALALAGHVAREALLMNLPVCRWQLLGTLLAAQHHARR